MATFITILYVIRTRVYVVELCTKRTSLLFPVF